MARVVDQGIGVEPRIDHHAVDEVVYDGRDAVDTAEPLVKAGRLLRGDCTPGLLRCPWRLWHACASGTVSRTQTDWPRDALVVTPASSDELSLLVMPGYRFCTVGSDGRFIAGEDIECADDQEAIKKATQAAKGSVIELWERDRSSNCCLLRRRIGNLPSVASDEP